MLEQKVRKLNKNYIFSLAVLSDVVDPDDFDKRDSLKNDFVFFCRKQDQNISCQEAWQLYKITKKIIN